MKLSITTLLTTVILAISNTLPTLADNDSSKFIYQELLPKQELRSDIPTISVDDIKSIILNTSRKGILGTIAGNASLKGILSKRRQRTNNKSELPTTEGANKQSNRTTEDRKNGTSSQGDDGLKYDEPLKVPESVYDKQTIWSRMDYKTVKSKTSKQWLVDHGKYAFTDDVGFRKTKYNGHEYYNVAMAAYFATGGKLDSKASYKDSIFAECNRHVFRVTLEDESVVYVIMGDAKSQTDALMEEHLYGHWASSAKNSLSIIETIDDDSVWLKHGINGSTSSAYHTYHKNSPWTAPIVSIARGPELDLTA